MNLFDDSTWIPSTRFHYLLHQSVNLYIIRSDSRKKSAISQNMPFFLFALFANWCFGKFGSVSGNLVNRQFMLSLATVVPAVDINNCTCHCTHHCCSFRSTTLLESVCALLPTILPNQIKLSYKRQTVSMAVGGSQCSSLFPCPSHHHCRLHLR